MADGQAATLLMQEIFTLVLDGSDVCEDTPDPKRPCAPAEHYDALARAFVTLARIHPDPEFTVRQLARALPIIEHTGHARYRNVQNQLGFPKDAETEMFRRLPPDKQDAYLAALEQKTAEVTGRLRREIGRMA